MNVAKTYDTNPAKQYYFGGWYTDAACTQAYDPATYTPAENATEIVLYAKWNEKAKVTFSDGSYMTTITLFAKPGGNVTAPSATASRWYNANKTAVITTLSGDSVVKFTFKNWTNGTETVNANGSYTVNKNVADGTVIAFTAQFSETTYYKVAVSAKACGSCGGNYTTTVTLSINGDIVGTNGNTPSNLSTQGKSGKEATGTYYATGKVTIEISFDHKFMIISSHSNSYNVTGGSNCSSGSGSGKNDSTHTITVDATAAIQITAKAG